MSVSSQYAHYAQAQFTCHIIATISSIFNTCANFTLLFSSDDQHSAGGPSDLDVDPIKLEPEDETADPLSESYPQKFAKEGTKPADDDLENVTVKDEAVFEDTSAVEELSSTRPKDNLIIGIMPSVDCEDIHTPSSDVSLHSVAHDPVPGLNKFLVLPDEENFQPPAPTNLPQGFTKLLMLPSADRNLTSASPSNAPPGLNKFILLPSSDVNVNPVPQTNVPLLNNFLPFINHLNNQQVTAARSHTGHSANLSSAGCNNFAPALQFPPTAGSIASDILRRRIFDNTTERTGGGITDTFSHPGSITSNILNRLLSATDRPVDGIPDTEGPDDVYTKIAQYHRLRALLTLQKQRQQEPN